jgi:hypothetical protein
VASGAGGLRRIIMEHKLFPLGDQTFQEIRQNNFIYADKTEYIHNIIKDIKFKFCFLSRPRRFGKSLLLDTIDSLFQGDRKLFEGLWIDKSDYQFEKGASCKCPQGGDRSAPTQKETFGMNFAKL